MEGSNKTEVIVSENLILKVTFYNFCCNFFFSPHCVACGILVPRLGIEPVPHASEAWSLNHWTAREVPL